MLRAIGISKSEMMTIIMMETLSCTMSSVVVGYVLAYIEVLVGMSLLRNGFEMAWDWTFYWKTFTIIILVSGLVI